MFTRGRLLADLAAVVLASCLLTTCQAGAGVPSSPPSAAGRSAEPSPQGCRTEAPSCLGLLAPGTHRTSKVITPFSFTVPEGWEKTLDVAGSFNLEDRGHEEFLAVWPDFVIASQSVCTTTPEPGIGRASADLVGWLAAHPGLVTTEPARVTIGGLEGQSLEVRKDAEWASGTCPGRVNLFTHEGTIDDIGWELIDNAITMRLAILDTADGHTVMIALLAPHAAIDAFDDATRPIIESFDFTP